MLTGEGLVREFPGTVAVDGVTIELGPGSVVGIVGPNGVGKTTLLDLLSGAGRPDRGRVSYRGRDITGLSEDGRARMGIVRTVQRPAWFSGLTVLENVRVGARSADRARRELELVGMGGREREPGDRVSSAGRKLGELARVAAMCPRVVLLDEPSAGHDDDTRAVLVRCVRRWAEDGIAVLVVDHDRELVREVCDLVWEMRDGRLLGSGVSSCSGSSG